MNLVDKDKLHEALNTSKYTLLSHMLDNGDITSEIFDKYNNDFHLILFKRKWFKRIFNNDEQYYVGLIKVGNLSDLK